jgi:F0F1-type ATP synthase delta subunit
VNLIIISFFHSNYGSLSIVIPVNNEQNNVIHLADEIERTFKDVEFLWEVIWVVYQDKRNKVLPQIFSAYSKHIKEHHRQVKWNVVRLE